MIGLSKLKLYAIGLAGLLITIFTFGKYKESQGKSKEKAKQSERLLDDIQKANAAKRDPVKRKRVRKKYNP